MGSKINLFSFWINFLCHAPLIFFFVSCLNSINFYKYFRKQDSMSFCFKNVWIFAPKKHIKNKIFFAVAVIQSLVCLFSKSIPVPPWLRKLFDTTISKERKSLCVVECVECLTTKTKKLLQRLSSSFAWAAHPLFLKGRILGRPLINVMVWRYYTGVIL